MPDGRPKLRGVTVAYLAGRVVVIAALGSLFAAQAIPFVAPSFQVALELGLALFALITVAVVALSFTLRPAVATMLRWVLVFDLVAGALLVGALPPALDSFYPWMIVLAVIYAIVLPRKESWAVSAAIAFAYVVAHAVGHGTMHGATDYVLIALKAAGIGLIGYLVAEVMHRQRERETDLETSHSDVESLNLQLQRRLAELNAVSEITEVIHSTLDFDAIGPTVLEIIQKVIDVPACSLLVLDKEKAETLFSASKGTSTLPANFAGSLSTGDGASSLAVDGGLFSCFTILDHAQMMVVFCASSDDIERMRPDDRLVLQAVASELAVAVENSQLYKLTKRLSITDELTGLFNYRYLQQRLEDEFERARRFDRSLSLLMIDADDFKLFNDRHGHIAGDLALAEVGQLLKSAVREIDVAARYGGEEFTVILPETDSAGAFVVAEKIRETIARHGFADADGNRKVRLTVSIGVATYPQHAEDRESLMRQADDALYHAKGLGRDRVRASQPVVASTEGLDADVEEEPA